MTNDCIFCRIVSGDVPADVVLETDHIVAFRDLSPQAPVHVLVIPREHVEAVGTLGSEHHDLAGHLLLAAREVAEREEVHQSGFRVVANTGREGGQSVDHLHLHVLGGRPLSWPPG